MNASSLTSVSLQSRVLGAVLGAAIGDALGHPTEFLTSRSAIEQRYGPAGVSGFELWWERDERRFAPYTDDTQMAEIVLRALVDAGHEQAPREVAMKKMADGFAHWLVEPQGGHRAPGNSCMAGARRLGEGVHWREAGGADAGGCGSVMRTYPFGLLFGDLAEAEHWAVEHSRMTHQAPIALAACAAMAVGVALELASTEPETCFASMVEAARRYDAGTADLIEQAVIDAASGADPHAVLATLEGWAAHEAIAAAAFVVARHPSDLRAALLEGANAPGDSDSIATLAGALLGARLGLEAIPADWIRDVERSDELLALGREAAELIGAQ
jgi:ADP-ribosylglycohydrolase